MTTFVTEFASREAGEVFGPGAEDYLDYAVRLGRRGLAHCGDGTASDDLAFAAYMTRRKLNEMLNSGEDYVSHYYLAAGEVSDLVTEHDAELLIEIDPRVRARLNVGPIGDMTAEVTAVHEVLLDVADYYAEAWAESLGGRRET